MKLYMAIFATSIALSCQAGELENASATLPVSNAQMSVSTEGQAPVVTVIAQVTNTSSATVTDVVLEATLTDGTGKTIDVLTNRSYETVIPAGQQLAIRLQGRTGAPAASYVAVKVRVASADVRYTYAPANDDVPIEKVQTRAFPWKDLLVSWGPMFLLIAVWLYFVQRASGKNSFQSKVLASYQEQTTLLAKQTAAIEAIAVRLQENLPSRY